MLKNGRKASDRLTEGWFQLTRPDAGGPGRQAAGRRAAVEGADVLRGQKLREDGALETLGLTAQQGGALRGHVHHFSRQERHGYGERVLKGERRGEVRTGDA